MKTCIVWLFLVIASFVVAADTKDRIRLIDGTELEGAVSNVDSKGYMMTTRFGRLHYTWSQTDLEYVRKNNPELYVFLKQQTAQELSQDIIQTDDQIFKFLAGKYSFQSETNKDLMQGGADGHSYYGLVLDDLDKLAPLATTKQGIEKLLELIRKQRTPLRAFHLRCIELLRNVGKTSLATSIVPDSTSTVLLPRGGKIAILNSILSDFQRGLDSLFKGDYSAFIHYWPKARKAVRDHGY